MYQMLTGKLPYRGTNKFTIIFQITQYDPPPPSSLRPEVPVSLDRIVRRAMQKAAAQRYQSGDELAEDLIEALRAGLGGRRGGVLGDADKFAALRGMRFFAAFADPELWEVIAMGSWEKVAAGTEMMREGEHGDAFCMVVQGEARVTKNKKLLSVLGPGECFGEMAYLSRQTNERSADVISLSPSRVITIRLDDLARASDACRHRFDRAFMSILVERLTMANNRLTAV
jgi:hypothetical protein